MARYSDEKKVAAARDYCSGQLGLRQVAQRHGLNVASLRFWAAAYRVHGARGVLTKDRKFYSAAFKLSVLQRIHSEKLSCRQAAALFDIRRRDMIAVWQRAYEIGGVAALHPPTGARRTAMAKQSRAGADKLQDERRTRKQLLDELHQLRMENAYLKQLKALAPVETPTRDSEPKSCKS
jgi:transposase